MTPSSFFPVYVLLPPVSPPADPSSFLLGMTREARGFGMTREARGFGMTPFSRLMPNAREPSAVGKIGGKRCHSAKKSDGTPNSDGAAGDGGISLASRRWKI
jgi:hypothetical protein